MKLAIPNLLSIKLLIFAFFLIGLENIQLPPIEKHEWRQTLTLSIAQNFLDDPNIFYPRMDIGGKTDGTMACEFPIFNYLLAFFFKIFGVHHWYGRLLNWTISCIGLWFFYDLVRKSTNARTALFSTIALMGSIVFQYARKTMPDTFALFVTTAGVWFLWHYLENQSRKYLVAGFLLTTCGILSKIPFVVMLLFLIVPFFDKQFAFKAKRNLTIAVSVAMGCVTWWYFYWMPYLLEEFGNQLIWPVSLTEGWKVVMEQRLSESWEMLIGAPFHYKFTFLLSVMGLGCVLTGSNAKLKWLSLAYIAIFFLFTLKTGIVFPTHDYYIIPLVPLLALFIGYLFDQLQLKNAATLALLMASLIAGFIHYKKQSFTPYENRGYLMALGDIMAKYTQPNDKIMVNNGPYSPGMMYWAKRKGWTVNTDVPHKAEWMPDFKAQGLKYILLDRHLSNDTLPYSLLYEDQHFRLYGL